MVLVLLTTAPLIDALRRDNVLTRPEFYLLVTLYLYGTCGYLVHVLYTAKDFGFIIPVSGLAIHKSYLFSSAAIFAVYIGGRFYRSSMEERAPGPPSGDRLLPVLAAAGCLLALAFNVYYFYTFGLFSGSFNRVAFIDEFKTQIGAKVPYLALMYASLPILALRERLPVSWFIFLPFALLHLSVGNRRIVLAALILILVAKLLRGMRIRMRTLAAALAIIGVVGVMVGDIRGRGGAFSALANITFERIFLALSEFTRPFVTLTYYVDNGYDLLYGRTIVQAFINLVPGFLLPFSKSPSPGREFIQVVEELGVYPDRVSGYGFYPVAEALINFGPVGVPLCFLALTLLVRKLSDLSLATGFAFVVPVLCATLFGFGRGSFTNLLGGTVWILAIGVALHLSARLVRRALKLGGRGSDERGEKGLKRW